MENGLVIGLGIAFLVVVNQGTKFLGFAFFGTYIDITSIPALFVCAVQWKVVGLWGWAQLWETHPPKVERV